MSQLQPTTETADPESVLLARAYALILSWGCPKCGKPYPCPCDVDSAAEAMPKAILDSDSEAERVPMMMIPPRDVISTENRVATTDTGNLSVRATVKTTAKKKVITAAIQQ